MSDFSLETAELHGWIDRFRAGDTSVIDILLRRCSARLERLSRKMTKQFPRVQRWADPEDVLQNASLRLIRALKQVRPGSVREFYGLAATQIRRELLDLTRSLFGPEGAGANHDSLPEDSSSDGDRYPVATYDPDAAELEKWCRFHEQVEKLPAEEREVVGLIFYHGWSQQDVADLFQVSVRTIQRWWQAALLQLQDTLAEWPRGESSNLD